MIFGNRWYGEFISLCINYINIIPFFPKRQRFFKYYFLDVGYGDFGDHAKPLMSIHAFVFP